jgi:hypothetical protein
MTERRGDWMQTAYGRQFWPLDPRPGDVYIDDIAAALSKMCRFGGHCRRFYSVAEHSIHVARAASQENRFAALMHDASEAYLCDIVRPLKPFLANYSEIEAALEKCIAERFKLAWPWAPEIKNLDSAMLSTERDQVMAAPPAPWKGMPESLDVRLGFWTPEQAEHEFLVEFSACERSRVFAP